jgi:hypothetical protein
MSPLCRDDCYHDKNKSNYMKNDYSILEVIKTKDRLLCI